MKIPDTDVQDARSEDSADAPAPARAQARTALVIGGGIIGLEMGTVYDALGSKVSVVEFMDGLIPGADRWNVIRRIRLSLRSSISHGQLLHNP